MWNISNLLSLFRVFLALPMGLCLWYHYNIIAVCLGLLSSITDILDGHLARKLNQTTEFGKIIDPLADKLFVGVTVIILLIQERLALWFALTIWGRDLIILLAGLYAAKKTDLVIPSNFIGKFTVIILGFTLMFIILELQTIIPYTIGISVTLLILSLINYGYGMVVQLKKHQKQH